MSQLARNHRPAAVHTSAASCPHSASSPSADARSLYAALSVPAPTADATTAAADYLRTQLQPARALPCELPAAPAQLADWIAQRVSDTGTRYAAYLAERKAGGRRHYFANKSHALYFLRAAAPTKLVDGAWLYGTLPYWRDAAMRPLILTYLEELGDGDAAMNHITLYQKLLATHDCEHWQSQPPALFTQGAIQLALACQTAEFLPEVIGYNLGYEQLPLHLLITAYELDELGIDPYYFKLHVTIDNAASGHAQKAAQTVIDIGARQADPQAFYQRVRDGYRLNDLGLGTPAIIAAFDIEEELIRILENKAVAGQNMHSDYCRFGGKTVNAWLADPATCRQFLAALQHAGWIVRGSDPQESRFWRLISGAGAEMFGVFNGWEQQVLHDWIQGPGYYAKSGISFRAAARQRLRTASAAGNDNPSSVRLLPLPPASAAAAVVDPASLIAALAPGQHHLPSGLRATRLFSQLVRTQ
jgi:hypothetical protein